MRGKRVCSIVPLLGNHLSNRIVGCFHGIAVCICDLLQPPAAVLVIVADQLIGFAVHTDRLQIVKGIVREGILHPVASRNLGHIIERIVSI